MSILPGLFSRGPSYYLRVVLPEGHPAAYLYRSGRVILSLGACSQREATSKGILMRAAILSGHHLPGKRAPQATAAVNGAAAPMTRPSSMTALPMQSAPAGGAHPGAFLRLSQPHIADHLAQANLRGPNAYFARLAEELEASTPVYLRDVFDQWIEAKPRSKDSVAACRRALLLYEEQTGNPPLCNLNRAAGLAFRSWLQRPERGTTSKTARDRFTWIKSLLKFAQVDMEAISRSPWEGLDIEQVTTQKRRPWTDEELTLFFSQPLHAAYELPADTKAGGAAAYWIPLLGLYTGARISELVQLRRKDVERIGEVEVLNITDDGPGQQLKTTASVRKVPLHKELIRLGFLDYVRETCKTTEDPLWPAVPLRAGKPGGFFSQWFGTYRRSIGFGSYPDFHCLRHTVRSALANTEVAEPVIDQLVGHEVKGSTGAKVYTHRTMLQLKTAVEKITYPCIQLARVYRTS